MTPLDVLKKYGSQYGFNKQTGMNHALLGRWLKLGYVPENAQYKLEVITKGELKTEWSEENERKG